MNSVKGFKLDVVLLPEDRIRVYDFYFTKESYIEGKIVSVEMEWLEVMCDYDSNDDKRKLGVLLKVPLSCRLDEVWQGDRIIKLG